MNSGVSQRYRNLPRESILNEHGFIRDVLEKGRFLGDEHFPLAEKIFRRFLKKWKSYDTNATLRSDGSLCTGV